MSQLKGLIDLGWFGELPRHCPRCESPAPHLHPAMQYEGEVQPCEHPFHADAPGPGAGEEGT
jgi:hypothetical protein